MNVLLEKTSGETDIDYLFLLIHLYPFLLGYWYIYLFVLISCIS